MGRIETIMAGSSFSALRKHGDLVPPLQPREWKVLTIRGIGIAVLSMLRIAAVVMLVPHPGRRAVRQLVEIRVAVL